MHLTISLFYHDLTHHILEHGFSDIFGYAINYLVHYPKLSVYYPPLYHFLISIFFNFSISVTTARLVTLLFSLGSIVVTYKITEFLTNRKNAVIVSVFMAFAPVFVINSRHVMMTIPLLFFSLLTFYAYLRAFENGSVKFFLGGGVLAALTFLTKWMGLITIPIIFIYWLWTSRDKNLLKKFVLSILIALILLSPYLLVYKEFHLLELTMKGPIKAGYVEGDPQFTEIRGWIYYPKKLLGQLSLPLGILSLFATISYILRKEKNWKLITTWVLTTYLTFTIIPNKSVRYTVFYLPAFLIPTSFYLRESFKKKSLVGILVVGLVGFAVLNSYFLIPKFSAPYNEVTEYVYKNTKGNIAFISESGEMRASVFIFHMLKHDRNLSLSVSRPCIFKGQNTTQIENILEENNIYYLIYVPGQGAQSERISKFDNIELEENYDNFKLYRVKGFEYQDKNYICNYICRVKGWICNNMSYKEIYRRGIFGGEK